MKSLSKDNFNLTCTHFAARNGYLEILQFLESKGAIDANSSENRFHTYPLVFSIAMKHDACAEFLASRSIEEVLNSGLLSACQPKF